MCRNLVIDVNIKQETLMTHPDMTLNRRTLLQSSAAALALAGLPAGADAAAGATGLAPLLARFAEEILQLTPESATGLGFDSGKHAALKSRLSDGSAAGEARWAAQVASMQTRLKALKRESLTAVERVRYDTVRYAAERGIEAKAFAYDGAASGFFGGASPYVLTQQSGALSSIPEFLNSQHQIKTKADAEAYLARIDALVGVLDAENVAMGRNAAMGVVPPNFVAANALGQLKAYRAEKAGAQGIVGSLAERATRAGVAGDWAARAARLVEQRLYPAVDRQIAAFEKSTAAANDVAGVHKLPDGEAYYAWALKLGTTTTLSPQEIHAIGLEQNKAIQARMDGLLKAQGMTQGSVGERLLALTKDAKMLYADTDAGRADLIAYCNDKVTAQRALLPKLSKLGLKAPLIIKRVPADIQDGASLGYMNFASLDGSRPAIYYINLKSTSLWPKYQLATLTAHEGVPGHAWQGAYLAEHSKEIPLISSLTGFNAFVEGWALYAEQLMDENGLYANDPLSQLGYLQAQQFRACRLVVDTGLHALRWTRDQSVQFLVENTGRGVGSMTSETDRYCVSPGQACGYKVGHNEILRLRETAKTALGEKFDVALFNDEVVRTGGVPLTVLATVISDFIKRSKA
jgi:uncharacterized protein (DUF885 family)